MFASINPATGERICEFEAFDARAIDRCLTGAEKAFHDWKATSFSDRSQMLSRAADLLRDQRGLFANIMTTEMGKPIRQAEAEVEKCAWVCIHYAEHAEKYLAARNVKTDARSSFIRHEPLGPVLAVMPWNFPFWQVFRFAAPALMAGNVGLLKHASNVQGCAQAIETLFYDAGLPEGVFSNLPVSSDQVDELVSHPAVKAVTLTGSEAAGSAVARVAGRNLKKCVLELGGSDPFIVLQDADIPLAAKQAAKARTQNSGQSCIAAKRFIVEKPIAEEFTQLFTDQLQQLKVGDPSDPATEVGPLAREDLRQELHEQVQRSINSGADLRAGGVPLEGIGYFYPPTLLASVTPGMAVFDEETFGPVAAVTTARDAGQAIELANKSPYGLGASIWSADVERALELAPRLEAGSVFINEIVKSDPRLPFGGIKRSGYGRELADYGILEFVNAMTVWVGENNH